MFTGLIFLTKWRICPEKIRILLCNQSVHVLNESLKYGILIAKATNGKILRDISPRIFYKITIKNAKNQYLYTHDLGNYIKK